MSDERSSLVPSMEEILVSIRRILAEDERVVTRPAPSPRARGNGGDVLDLTEAINEDGSVRHISPVALVTPESAPRLSDGRIEPVPPRQPDAGAAEPQLVSAAASDAVATSFAKLANISRREEGDPSLDDLVRETLRPMLQAWLDENLPGLVERLVRAEIARVVGSIRPAAP